MEQTVNQLLDVLTSNFAYEEIDKNIELKRIHDKLLELKIKYCQGGILGIKNSGVIMDKIMKYKLAV